MTYKSFSFQIAFRLGLIFGTLMALAFAIVSHWPLALILILGGVAVILGYRLNQYVNRTTKELANFLIGR